MIMTSGDKWAMKVGVGMMFCHILKTWKIAMKEKMNSMVLEVSGR